MPDEELICLALLYASGELDEADAAAFERRLAEDQAARDALCQAVELNVSADGEGPPLPDPSYRQRVRQRLNQRRRHLRKLNAQANPFINPALWTALGASAAVILMVVLHHLTIHTDRNPTPPTVAEKSLAEQRDELETRLKSAEVQADELTTALAGAGAERQRHELEERLRELARKLVDLEVQILTVKARQMAQELAATDAELTRRQAERDQLVQKRFEELLEKAKKMKS